MGQISQKFRNVQDGGHGHWCPGCGGLHVIPGTWTFNGDLNSPTFTPSVRITGKKTIKNERGEWTGEWVRDANGNPIDDCCHYILTAGQMQFCGDSTHALSGQTVPLPDLPDWLRD